MIMRRIRPSWNSRWGQLERMRRDMAQLLDAMDQRSGLSTHSGGLFPSLNVTHDDECFYVRAELPGIKPDELEITTLKDKLTIAGKRQLEELPKATSYHRQEREHGVFSRSITLPAEVDPERTTATYKDGILTMKLAKREEAKPRQITVAQA